MVLFTLVPDLFRFGYAHLTGLTGERSIVQYFWSWTQPHAKALVIFDMPVQYKEFKVLSCGFLVRFPVMLLILALVYFLPAFQTHAAPPSFTTLLTESSSNNITVPVLDIPACICPAEQRSVWDVLWACLATIFACAWVSVHPNIPGSNESSWRILLRRLELMF